MAAAELDNAEAIRALSDRGSSLKNLRPWPAGVSGNPGGRPARAPISKACREELQKTDPATGLTNAEAIAARLVAECKRGNIWAIRELVGLVEGVKRAASNHDEGPASSNNAPMSDIKRLLYEKLVDHGSVTIQQQTQVKVTAAETIEVDSTPRSNFRERLRAVLIREESSSP